jgi:TolB-like protein
MQLTTWDVPGKRALRRSNLQETRSGRGAEARAVGLDSTGRFAALSIQQLAEARGGALGMRGGMASPEDLRRNNVLIRYAVESGIAGDPVTTGDYEAERVAVAPGGCFAIFSSEYRKQPRLHLWNMLERGEDVFRVDLPAKLSALALDPDGRKMAAALGNGQIRTWQTSGLTAGDCDALQRRADVTKAGVRTSLGTETSPLIPRGAGFRLAVLRLETGGVEAYLGEAVAEMIAAELGNSKDIVLIERTAINAVFKELELQQSGLTAADAVRIGRGLNAEKVMLGSVRQFGRGTYVIMVRLVDVGTQQIQGAREVTCENCTDKDLVQAVRELRRALVF